MLYRTKNKIKKMNLKVTLALVLIICTPSFCQVAPYFPDKPTNLSNSKYEHYKNILTNGYVKGDNYSIAMGLANLGGEIDSVYKYLYRHLTVCNKEELYMRKGLCNAYKIKGFKTTFAKISESDWTKYCHHCDSLMSDDEYYQIYDKQMKELQSKKSALDSKKFNVLLMNDLKIIFEDDQKYREIVRKISTKFGENSLEVKQKWQEQLRLDQQNLTKVINIIKKYGYPTRQLVGDELSTVVFFVLHHAADISIHEMYLPYLENAVNAGDLDNGYLELFKYRIKMYHSSKN
jgi:hypothetical protein